MKFLGLLLICFILGCGGGTPSSIVEIRRSAQQAYDEGVQSLDEKDFSTAEKRFTEALELGGLYPDLYDSARASQVAALAALGNFEAAQAALAKLEQNAEQKDLVLATRSYLLEKQGKTREAKKAWAKARRVNRYVKKIKY